MSFVNNEVFPGDILQFVLFPENSLIRSDQDVEFVLAVRPLCQFGVDNALALFFCAPHAKGSNHGTKSAEFACGEKVSQ